jgi:hypothetical protein
VTPRSTMIAATAEASLRIFTPKSAQISSAAVFAQQRANTSLEKSHVMSEVCKRIPSGLWHR